MDYIPEKFWEERYQQLDLTRSGHRDLPAAYNRWLYRRKQAVLRAGLRSVGFDVAGQRVLEIGVGLGAYLPLWQRLHARHVSGVDLSAAAVQFLLEHSPAVSVAQRDATLPGLHEALGQFELIAALDVLYHVVDDDKLSALLRNVVETLAPQGVFAFHDQFLHRPTVDRGYIRWRSLADWEQLLAHAGLRILARRPIFFTMIQTNDCTSEARAARMDALWRRMVPWINRAPGLMGALTYAVDSTLGGVLGEGPSMELMLVCRAGERALA